MSFSFGGRNYEKHTSESRCEDGLFIQEGTTRLRPRSEQDVFYPVPYAHPPNLELGEDCDDCVILEQKEDHFRVKNQSFFTANVGWQARGIRHPAVTLPVSGPLPPPVQRPTLPSQPIPGS
jgi:hypothetical protein